MNIFKKRTQYEHLRRKWIAKNKSITQNLFDKHLKKVALGSLGGLMLLTSSGLSAPQAHQLTASSSSITGTEDKNALLKTELIDKVPNEVRNLTPEEENAISAVIYKDLGIKASGQLQGKQLNRTYGLIGGEQHLYRYPGDNVYAHARDAQDWAMFGPAGIAPGLGAWGYFSPSAAAMTKQDEERERWYIAVQTYLSPGFSEHVAEYRDFYKYRKMLVVNPKTGQAVVADIADAGPSQWTGKHLGGSPEVMHELGLATGPRKGAVIYFFIDDPNDQIPLGPVHGDVGRLIANK